MTGVQACALTIWVHHGYCAAVLCRGGGTPQDGAVDGLGAGECEFMTDCGTAVMFFDTYN